MREVESYNFNIYWLVFDINIGIKQHKIIALELDSRYYGNSFGSNTQWETNIHRYWTNNYIIRIEYV